jgi:hypothetical protein
VKAEVVFIGPFAIKVGFQVITRVVETRLKDYAQFLALHKHGRGVGWW